MHKLVFLLLSALLTSCGRPAAPPEPIRPVKVVVIRPQSNSADQVLAGEVRARYESPIAFRVGGKILERRINIGDTVKKGQVLARLEPTDLQLAAQSDAAAVSGARTELALAESELSRYRLLHEKGFISTAVLDQKQAAVDTALARLKAAEASHTEKGRQVGYSTLVADADGVVTWLQMDVGQVVAAGEGLLKIAQTGTREIEVHVPEARMQEFKAAKDFVITLNALPSHPMHGSLRELAASADSATRTYAARITMSGTEAGLALGMSASVAAVAETRAAIHLPLAAIVSRDGKPAVWKLDVQKSVVHAVGIQTSSMDGNDIVVSGGLNQGDIVVTAGANLLREGQQVRALP